MYLYKFRCKSWWPQSVTIERLCPLRMATRAIGHQALRTSLLALEGMGARSQRLPGACKTYLARAGLGPVLTGRTGSPFLLCLWCLESLSNCHHKLGQNDTGLCNPQSHGYPLHASPNILPTPMAPELYRMAGVTQCPLTRPALYKDCTHLQVLLGPRTICIFLGQAEPKLLVEVLKGHVCYSPCMPSTSAYWSRHWGNIHIQERVSVHVHLGEWVHKLVAEWALVAACMSSWVCACASGWMCVLK